MLRWTRVSFCLFETPANVKASYPVWLRIFQRKKLSHSRVCLVVFADYHTGSWGFMWERRSSVCTLPGLFSPLSLSICACTVYSVCVSMSFTRIRHSIHGRWGWWNATSPPRSGRLAGPRSAVRRRKWSCQRRDCEAGCWRFICSGGTAEVTGVKLLHLLATTASN